MGINMEFYVKITPQGDLFTIFIISLVCFLLCPNLSSEWDFPLAFFMFVEAVGELLTGFCVKKKIKINIITIQQKTRNYC